MRSIAFLDTEIEPKSRRILDVGVIKHDGTSLHSTSVVDLKDFLKGSTFICGHNVIYHDLLYVGSFLTEIGINLRNAIDTLFLSPLLFPSRPYHALVKDDKLQTDERNNPLNDAIKAKDLLNDEVVTFLRLPERLQNIYYQLLKDQREFQAFFSYINFQANEEDLIALIRSYFSTEICDNIDIDRLVSSRPIEMAYALALIHSFMQNKMLHSATPPWVLKRYPNVDQLINLLRNKPCIAGCSYCDQALDVKRGLKRFFGFESYRTYAGEPLQEQAVQAAVDNKSILAVFPTGGGKSITFQIPALMSADATGGLTVVISPLQSLMKDQVDNLEKIGITDAVTINGLLDPIERAKSFQRVEDGSASILYLSPESLRSRTIEKLILGRKIARFVIDEAHCFSSWGQDFRVDYLYIGDFIKAIQQKKNLEEGICVSCFTATAKQKVIEDIQTYFRDKLSLDLALFTSSASRTNLHYTVYEKRDEEEKYLALRNLIEANHCPSIVYVSRTKKAQLLAQRLTSDGFVARTYHGKMDVHEKTANQNAFIAGEIPIMVATSAFGMGVDKKDVGMVIHYEISDSLENYVQEAGRAGRDEKIQANCFVLYNEEDLSKHFILLNQTKLSIKEIQQVWKAIKDLTRFRASVSQSALEIARKAGWDDNVADIETRVTTAIAALEDAGYLRRGQNMPRVYANSILAKSAQEAIDKIVASERFEFKDREKAVRIIKKLFSSKSKVQATDEVAESRVDYIGDHLGIIKEDVIRIINLLREEKILADAQDLTAFIRRGDNKNRSLAIVESFCRIEGFLLPFIQEEEQTLNVKELNETAEAEGLEGVTVNKLKTIFNFWAIKNWIKRRNRDQARNYLAVLSILTPETLKQKLEKQKEVARFIVDYLYKKSLLENNTDKEEVLVEFSVIELQAAFNRQALLFSIEISIYDVEDTLFFLSRIDAIKIDGGFLVLYNKLAIERLEQDNKIRYKLEDYQKLSQFYESKIQQIHIVGEYAKRMISDYKDALQFVEDYFHLNYSSFLNKYFKGSRQNEICRNITPSKFKQLFGELSPTQLKIINDNVSKHIVVAAGPGSGKTRVLVHKLASLLLMEDVKHEQLLMLTFSRAAATEFKKRLLALIGNAANFIEIKTFHSYCFDLLGRVGNLERASSIIKTTIEMILNNEVEASKITKTVLVIDEAQDMDEHEFGLVKALMEYNEEMRVIAVGDDDQNIYEFRGADSKYLIDFIDKHEAEKYELIENYRSHHNLVDFTNQFVSRISRRLKSNPIVSRKAGLGNIKIVRYDRTKLLVPVATDILQSDLRGTTCVLTKSNEEAMYLTALLLSNGRKAKLIQSNEGFSLANLVELRFFINQLNLRKEVFTIDDQVWDQAKKAVRYKYSRSTNLDLCMQMISDFEIISTKRKYRSDWDNFVIESKMEDFYRESNEVIFVSTIHKSKGKEFDNVFLMLDRFNVVSDQELRQLYVALTRAKRNISVHLNSSTLNGLKAQNLTRIDDFENYPQPKEIAMHLSHKDIWLDYFMNRQHIIDSLQAGDELVVDSVGCSTSQGSTVLKFSKEFANKIAQFTERNYIPVKAKVNFIIYWQKEGVESQILILLPEVYFQKG